MRRTDLDEFDDPTTHFDLETPVERAVGKTHVDVGELERSEEAPEQFAHFARCRVERGEHCRWNFGHLVGGRRRRDDLGSVHELIAVAVIAVGMGVDQRANGRGAGEGRERIEHLLSEPQVEQGVDEQRRTVTHHQAGIAPPPTAVGLEVGQAAIAQLVHADLVVRHVGERNGA